MKRFRFRLETVLRLRRIREERALSAFARYRRAVEAAEAQVGVLQREREEEIDRMRRELAGRPSADVLVDANAYLYATARKVERTLQALAAIRIQEARARTVWQEAATARKAIEDLRARRLGAWRLEASREEQRQVDEVASLASAREAARRGGVLSALGVVLVVLLAGGLAAAGYLASTGQIDRQRLSAAVEALRGRAPVGRPLAAGEGKGPAAAPEPEGKEVDPIERARRLKEVSQALSEAVRENEKNQERRREEAMARRRMLELLRDDLLREIEELKKQELAVRKEREAMAEQAAQAPSRSKPVEPERVDRYVQMMKRMKPREIKDLLAGKSDEEVAKSLALLDAKLSAKVLQEFLADPKVSSRAPRIGELVQDAGKEPRAPQEGGAQ